MSSFCRFVRDARGIFAVSILLVVFCVGAPLLCGSLRDAAKGIGCPVLGAVCDTLQRNFPRKYDLIDVNGGIVRLIGRRMCNERILRRDGMLDYMYTERHADVDSFVEAVSTFEGRVRELGIAFLYVQAPVKIPLRGNVMPDGWSFENPVERACRVVDGLRSRGIRALDLVPEFSATEADVAQNFFRTDHHWRPRAAFRAAQLLAEELSLVLKEPALRYPRTLDKEGWDERVLRGCFLGAHGRRTGRFFSRLDDFEILVPRFNTDISRSVPGRRTMRGRFEEAVLSPDNWLRRPLHKRNMYSVYGNDVGEMSFLNHAAPSAARVMIVKDSFANPVAAFLATVFREVVVVDPRRLTSPREVVELVARHRPDAVVELVNPVAFNNDKFKLGLIEGCR